MTFLEQVLFWSLTIIVLYVYFGYPLLLVLLAKFFERPIKRAEIYPLVSLVISAHNEEQKIGAKIENCLKLDYPKEKLDIVVASDGSTDGTNDIVREYTSFGVKLVDDPVHRGKSVIQNKAIPVAKGEIIVFSDATGLYDRSAVKMLARNFNDSSVGCVGGVVVDVNSASTSISRANTYYWRYEIFLRRKESQIGVLSMVSGSIFAIRRELYLPLKMSVPDDFFIPMSVVEKGYRVVYEPDAISREKIASTVGGKWRQKVRNAILDMTAILEKKNLLNPFRYPLLALSLFSHKILRWLVPVILIWIFCVNIVLFASKLQFYQVTLGVQILFYLLSFMGWLLYLKGCKNRLFYVPFYFCLLNAAALWAMLNFLFGRRITKWTTERKEGPSFGPM